MKILLTNDDGIHAIGLNKIKNNLSSKYAISIVAPLEEQSAKGHSFTMWSPLFVKKVNSLSFGISGTPADCVYVGLNHLFPETQVVLSGINHGLNMGSDLHYSGTVAAAREGALNGRLALAVSTNRDNIDWSYCLNCIEEVLDKLIQIPLKANVFYNLNIPARKKQTDIKVCSIGERHYEKTVDVRTDPRGRTYYWIGGPPIEHTARPDTDVFWFNKGHATLTPVSLDQTAYGELEPLKSLF
ncbi:MAG: 5'/3'-nucleotidase SurE [Myxococcota bacterium]|nr:5'/3'-nucleotidase SurE [Myxococcota bacterium]